MLAAVLHRLQGRGLREELVSRRCTCCRCPTTFARSEHGGIEWCPFRLLVGELASLITPPTSLSVLGSLSRVLIGFAMILDADSRKLCEELESLRRCSSVLANATAPGYAAF